MRRTAEIGGCDAERSGAGDTEAGCPNLVSFISIRMLAELTYTRPKLMRAQTESLVWRGSLTFHTTTKGAREKIRSVKTEAAGCGISYRLRRCGRNNEEYVPIVA